MLLRSDPFREFDRLTSRLFDGGETPWMPVDAFRHGDVFTLQFDIPGVDPASIEVTVERNELKVEAERPARWPEDAQLVMRERPVGRFTRRMFVSDNLDTDHLTADYEHGVLWVRIPMREQAKPRRIEVGTSQSQRAINVSSSKTST
jgi:HSP20 family protein